MRNGDLRKKQIRRPKKIRKKREGKKRLIK